MNLQAYKISCDDGDHGQLVQFAKRGKDLSKRANSEHCDCEFIDIQIRRAPEFDKYSPGPLTIENYLAEGWHWGCGGCSDQVWAEDGPIIVNDHVYHGMDCVRKDRNRWSGDEKHQWHESLIEHVRLLGEYIAKHGEGK